MHFLLSLSHLWLGLQLHLSHNIQEQFLLKPLKEVISSHSLNNLLKDNNNSNSNSNSNNSNSNSNSNSSNNNNNKCNTPMLDTVNSIHININSHSVLRTRISTINMANNNKFDSLNLSRVSNRDLQWLYNTNNPSNCNNNSKIMCIHHSPNLRHQCQRRRQPRQMQLVEASSLQFQTILIHTATRIRMQRPIDPRSLRQHLTANLTLGAASNLINTPNHSSSSSHINRDTSSLLRK